MKRLIFKIVEELPGGIMAIMEHAVNPEMIEAARFPEEYVYREYRNCLGNHHAAVQKILTTPPCPTTPTPPAPVTKI